MNRYHNLNIYGHIALELGADNTLSGSTQNSHNVPTADISFLRFTGTNPMVSGFADGANNNKILIVSFVPDEGASGGVLTLKHESSYSTSGNRIKTNDGNDLVLNPFESAFLLYDSYDTVWRVVSSPSAAAGGNTFSSINITGAGVVFEGATANEFETTLTVTDPTADRTITLPNATTTVVGTDVSQTLTNKTIDLANNTFSGTLSQFNTALTDADFVSIAGIETLTSKTLQGFTLTGDVTVTGTAIDVDLIDNNSSAISFDSAGKTGILEIDTTDGAEKVKMSGALEVSGNLTVSGTTTNINTTNLVVEDKNIILGDVTSPTNTTADGGGITLLGTTDKTLNWVNSTTSWTSSENFDIASGKTYRINGTTVLSATQVLGKSVPTGDFVGTSDSQVLTGKTISGADNTISNIGNASLTNSSISINGGSVSLGGSITVRSFTSANITTNTTVTAWTQNFVFTSNGAITVTLPASPSNGDRVRVIDADYGSAGTNITVGRNSNKINNVADDLLIDINGAAIEFVYNSTAGNWQIINTPI